MTNIKIYQGNQIGGCITEISTDTTKIIIDFGESLPGAEVVENIEYDWAKENVDAVFFTHYHGDHIGRFMEIPDDVDLYMGEVTRKVLINLNTALHNSEVVDKLINRPGIHYLEIRKTIEIGDIKVTPYLVDHSAFDAFMFLVETPDKNILHTGDYRDHGHRGHKRDKDGNDVNVMLEVINRYVKDYGRRKIDVLITEGTMLGGRANDERVSEAQMYEKAKALFKDNKYVFLKISSTNVDSLETFYHAARKNGMSFYCNKYVLKQLKTFSEAGRKYSKYYDFKEVWPILFTNPEAMNNPKYKRGYEGQRRHMREEGFVILVSEYDNYDRLIEEFSDLPTIFIYSLWDGYIKKDVGKGAYNEKLAKFCDKHNAILMHTSGHAYPEFIEQVKETVGAEEVITIHTERNKIVEDNNKYRDCKIIIDALNNGNHDEEFEFLKRVTEDSDLFFGIRHNKLQLYKSRAMVVEISYKTDEDRLVYTITTTKDLGNKNEGKELKFTELKEQFPSIVGNAKNKYRDRRLFEEICQQWIVDKNNKYGDDYYYVDMEFNIQDTRLGRIDMIAISRKKIDGKHKVILIELKVGKKSIAGTWKFDDNHKNDKDIESRIFNCDKKHPLKYGHGIVGHIVDYYRLISDENYNIIKTNICKMLNCQSQLGYLKDIHLANIEEEDLAEKPEVLIACYTRAPRSSYDSSNDEENNQPESIDELKREVHKCLYKEKRSKYNLEEALPKNLINGFMDVKTEHEKLGNTLKIEQLLNNKKYAFTIKFIDADEPECWKCI